MGGSCSIATKLTTTSSLSACFASTFSATATSSSSISPSAYQIHSIIGKGGYSTVYLGKHQKFRQCAIKRTQFLIHTPEFNENDLDMALAELNALKRIGSHSFITKLHAAFHVQNNCYLVLEYHSGGDLRYHLRTSTLFQESHVAYIVACVGSALHHLHQNGIIHRDVKPENILLAPSGIPKLTDFGTVYIEEECCSLPICSLSSGTLPYMAPEVLTKSRYHSYQCDYWSLGVTAFELLFNARPFTKHCPKRFIYFSGNQYQCLWETLISLQPHWSSSQAEAEDGIGPHYSFEQLDREITNESRVEKYPFPSQPLPLLADGSLPYELNIAIPTITFSREQISNNGIQFLQSLLDVRIPQRLGQLSQFELFSNHPWFQQYSCENIHTSLPHQQLDPCLPPFRPTLSKVEEYLKTKHEKDLMIKDPFLQNTIVCEDIPDEIRTKLDQYLHEPELLLSPPSLLPSSLPSLIPLKSTSQVKKCLTTSTKTCDDYSEEHVVIGHP